MARTARILGVSGIYHIVLRGVNKQNIFEDDMDRCKMIKILQKYGGEMLVEYYAWCFMNNHIHLLLRAKGQDLVTFMKKIEISYALYFNRKYDRVGHLFQDRYKSSIVEGESYFVSVVRYIHQNPYKAGICRPEDFGWSSYDEYIKTPVLCNTDELYSIIEEREFRQLMEELVEEIHIDYEDRITDDEAYKIIEECMAPEGAFAIQGYNKRRRDEKLRQMHERGLRISQISRVTGIPETTIRRACR